jgi:hypothetical protein
MRKRKPILMDLTDQRFIVSLLLLVPAWATIWIFHTDSTLVTMGFGTLTAVAGYWIGTSKSSSDKDDTISAMPAVIEEKAMLEEKHCCNGSTKKTEAVG